VRRAFDPDIERIVAGWPATFEQLRGRALGFSAHEPLVELVRAFVADDLEATRQDRGLA